MGRYGAFFTAIDKDTGDIVDIDFALHTSEGGNYICKVCGKRMDAVKNEDGNKTWHFRHHGGKSCMSGWRDSKDSIGYHKKAQQYFLDNIPGSEAEKYIENSDGNYHIADIFINNETEEYKGTVIEIQKSPMRCWHDNESVSARKSDFDDRNKFYTDMGYQVVWIFLRAEEFINGRIDRYKDDFGTYVLQEQTKTLLKEFMPQDNKDIHIFFQHMENSDSDNCLKDETLLENIVYHELSQNSKNNGPFSNWIINRTIKTGRDLVEYLIGERPCDFAFEKIAEFRPITKDIWKIQSKSSNNKREIDEGIKNQIDSARETDDQEILQRYVAEGYDDLLKAVLSNNNVIDQTDGTIYKPDLVADIIGRIRNIEPLRSLSNNPNITKDIFEALLRKIENAHDTGDINMIKINLSKVSQKLYQDNDETLLKAYEIISNSKSIDVLMTVAKQNNVPDRIKYILKNTQDDDVSSHIKMSQMEELNAYQQMDDKEKSKVNIPLILTGEKTIGQWFYDLPSAEMIDITGYYKESTKDNKYYRFIVSRSDYQYARNNLLGKPMELSSPESPNSRVYYWEKMKYKLNRMWT